MLIRDTWHIKKKKKNDTLINHYKIDTHFNLKKSESLDILYQPNLISYDKLYLISILKWSAYCVHFCMSMLRVINSLVTSVRLLFYIIVSGDPKELRLNN